ncbi:MAG: glycosyltransferase, partial [Pseudaminobacter sp.]|nr:glycosyltransferase [Pseudaminobacter sp.]
AGVPEVVRHGETGILTPSGDIAAYAQAVGHLLTHDAERRSMAASARRFVLGERSLDVAARRLSCLLAEL